MSDITGARWYVVQTQVNGEAKAAENLRRQGYEIYLPRYLKRRRHARKVDFTAKPLFPRYMFVAIDMATQRWRSIQSTVGVSRLVTNGDEPAAVPEGVVRALKAREDGRVLSKWMQGLRLRLATRCACSRAHSWTMRACSTEWRTMTGSPFCWICSAARFVCCSTRIWLWPRRYWSFVRRIERRALFRLRSGAIRVTLESPGLR